VFGGWGDGESDGNAAAFDTDRTGLIAGLDFGRANEDGAWRIGVFGMHIVSDLRIGALRSNAEVRQSGGGAYASYSTGALTAAVGGYITSVDLTASRIMSVPGFNASAAGVTEGDARQAFAELSYSFALGKGTLRPFVSGAVGSFDLDALTENRGGIAALAVGEQDYTTGSVTGGIDAHLPLGRGFTLAGTLAARAQLGDRDPQAQIALAGAPQQAFAIRAAQLDEVALAARFDAQFEVAEGVDFSIGYSGLIGSTIQDHGARATLNVRF
jgi:outer membrane autotransporter protein